MNQLWIDLFWFLLPILKPLQGQPTPVLLKAVPRIKLFDGFYIFELGKKSFFYDKLLLVLLGIHLTVELVRYLVQLILSHHLQRIMLEAEMSQSWHFITFEVSVILVIILLFFRTWVEYSVPNYNCIYSFIKIWVKPIKQIWSLNHLILLSK